ncbi:MAG: hypothetical protein A3C43_00520 [Candidatus Schekmanbacteria bacterium RIFCSPHIGHO2_02_FULL_38_11]|nr:MAG: hypothetical protein A3H37_05355 [Candidatus Schekmanbacteria bacterium RIFCSPLOWO2_02_FULL_38_14]OGL51995.1 MAG: hypothetical protein A3C43_00520 [Candidatus Schekmanbacteria bacterium RIFCSPHIGHO2_02_FULL_38_11]
MVSLKRLLSAFILISLKIWQETSDKNKTSIGANQIDFFIISLLKTSAIVQIPPVRAPIITLVPDVVKVISGRFLTAEKSVALIREKRHRKEKFLHF